MKRKLLLLLIFFTISNLIAKSAVFIDTVVVAKSGKHKLLFSVPKDYNKTKKYSLVVGLHKYGGAALDYRKNLQQITDSLNMIVACPDNSGQGFSDAQFDVIIASIDSAKSIYNIDEKSIYLNGMSLNATYVLHEGLKNLFPFKGIFPWAPYQPNTNDMDLNSKMPVVLSIGTADDYGDGATLTLYDSLKRHKANVNLVLLPGITHTSDFPSFGNEMIRCLYYLNDSGYISIQGVNGAGSDIDMMDNDNAKEIVFKASDKSAKDLTFSSLSSQTGIIANPQITYSATDSTLKIKITPTVGKSGTALIILEAREKNGIAIKQVTLKVNVKKFVGVVNTNLDSEFHIYPNPANDHFIVSTNSDIINKIEIIDLFGRLVNMQMTNNKEVLMERNKMVTGTYILKAYTNNKIFISKIIFN